MRWLMPVPLSSADVSSPRAGDAHLGRASDDPEIVATIPIKVPLPTLPRPAASLASDPEDRALVPAEPGTEVLRTTIP